MTSDDDPGSTKQIVSALLRSRPDVNAPDASWADWFDRMAGVFEVVAARDPHMATEATAMAADARAYARRLRSNS